MDFMYDVLEKKRSYRILNIIDDHSRECLCCEVSRSFGTTMLRRYWQADMSIRQTEDDKELQRDDAQ